MNILLIWSIILISIKLTGIELSVEHLELENDGYNREGIRLSSNNTIATWRLNQNVDAENFSIQYSVFASQPLIPIHGGDDVHYFEVTILALNNSEGQALSIGLDHENTKFDRYSLGLRGFDLIVIGSCPSPNLLIK